jgi:hypothetical protein
MALFIDVGPDDVLRIGENSYISVERKSGSRARLKIIGKSEVELMRKAKLQTAPQAHIANPPRQDTGD